MSFRLPLGLTQAIRLTILPRAHQAPQARFFTSTLPAFKPTPSPSSTPSLLRISIATATPLQASRPQCTPKNPFSLLRSFHTTRHNLMRPNYFPRNSGSGRKSSGSSGGPGFFRRMLISIENLPHTYIIYGLLGLNIAIYFLWEYAKTSYQRFRDPSLYQFMVKNFLINEVNIQAGRIWTFVTSCFSHSSGTHIFVNCLGLYFMAPAAAQLLGNVRFLGFYLIGGIASTMASLLWRRARGDRTTSSEGASGAIYSCMAFFAAMFPNTQFLLFFVVPMPAWLFAGGIFAYDLFGALYRPNSTTDSAGHLGGIVAGLGAAFLFRRGRFPKGPRMR